MFNPGEEPTPFEKYHQYKRGFGDGSSGCAMDPKRHCPPKVKNDPAVVLRPELVAFYEDGYTDGYRTRNRHLHEMARRCGYEPSVLRVGVQTGRLSAAEANISNPPREG